MSTSSSCSAVVSLATARVEEDALTAPGAGFNTCLPRFSSNCFAEDSQLAALSAPFISYLTRDVWKGRATVRDKTRADLVGRAEVLKDALRM